MKLTLPAVLHDAHSLTEKLRQAARHSFSVEVLAEHYISVAPSEVPLLNLTGTQTAWCRSVSLLVDDVIWVQAKTIIPVSSLEGPLQQLQHIQNKPLGDILFADPHLMRSAFTIDHTTRSSVFVFHGQPILVCETFLPNALAYFENIK